MSTLTETLYTPLTIANAPYASKPVLENIQKSFGFIPNLMAIFSNNPTVLQGYLALDAFYEKGSFTPRERQLILLAASVENHCNYCAAAHSTVAKGALHTPAEVVDAIRNNTPVPDKKLNALVALVKELVRERGYAKEETIAELHRRWLQEGASHGTVAWHCSQDHQQLSRSHLARACRSGIRG